MRYAESRDRLQNALHEAGLYSPHTSRRIERIELGDTARSWKIYLHRVVPPGTEPFHVSASVEFGWSPVNSARAYTSEEDVLTELLGRRRRPLRTERRWTRIDLSLRASLPYGSTTPMPEPQVFGAWTAAVVAEADAVFTAIEERKGRTVAVLGSHGGVELRARCGPDGLASLEALALSGFRMVRVPRVWDDPDRLAAERDPGIELRQLARMFRTAFDEWSQKVADLATWIRYSPPPPGSTPVGPWFDDQAWDDDDDDDDGGPETTH
ncbi:MAG: hypothetical protein AB1806_01910 [Acidobacteriota bacterium]